MSFLEKHDPQIAATLRDEHRRQEDGIELIASENYTSPAVLEVVGSVLTNKYAEGYPGRRYYGGCEVVDVAENLARDRARELFGAEHANVQPHSGSQANMAVFFSLLQPGDTILSLSLAMGGHLTHGHKVNFSGMLYNIVSYTLDRETERLDYDEIGRLAKEHQPKLIICGASAYPRTIDFAAFRSIADEVGAYLLADMAHIAGLVAAGEHASPVPHCDVVTTTTHKTLRGPRGGIILCKKEHAKAIDSKVMPGMQGGPLMHVIAAKAVAFKEAMSEEFKTYQRQVKENAVALGSALVERGFRLVSGGTENHLMLVDLTAKGVTGKDAEVAMGKAGLVCNRNMIPYDERSPMVTSGVRLGTPAITTRGMKTGEMVQIADFIDRAIAARDDDAKLQELHREVTALCNAFPVYPHLETVNA